MGLTNDEHTLVMDAAYRLGNLLWERTGGEPPALGGSHGDFNQYVPVEAAEAVAEAITMFAADLLQVWLDAGSERDVTYECLGPAVESHVLGWTGKPDTPDETGYEQGVQRAAFEAELLAVSLARKRLGLPTGVAA